MKRRTDYLKSWGHPNRRFGAGLLLMIPVIFDPMLPFKGVSLLFSVFLVCLSGKKIRWFYFSGFFFMILFFHLLLPFGEILWKWGSFKITKGALEKGLSKALTLLSLLFFSLATVTPKIKIPGTLGRFIGRVFYYFTELTEIKKDFKKKKIFRSMDQILFQIYPLDSPAEKGAASAENDFREGKEPKKQGNQKNSEEEPERKEAPTAGRKPEFWLLPVIGFWGLWGWDICFFSRSNGG